jgi:2',3'-cyclic-nucleotide 2'-phosphodiesterase (5'-nucleotidase family)
VIRVIHVTDVYTLEHFPSLKTLVAEAREQNVHGPTISVLTGDFLAPYLLSSLDKGRGMVKMLNGACALLRELRRLHDESGLTGVPIDFLTWGNHDIDDLDASNVMKRAQEYQGTLINTNMQAHPTHQLAHSKDHVLVAASSPDGSQTRRLGLIGILSKSANLYGNQIRVPEDVVIEDPWDTIDRYIAKLTDPSAAARCDVVVPLCHLYEHQDDLTCERFDIPVVLSGHDHHCVDRVHHGTRLLKAGQNANCAVILDLIWHAAGTERPQVEARTVSVDSWAPDPALAQAMRAATSVMEHLEHTQLCRIPDRFRPLESAHRDRRCAMGDFLCTTVKEALNSASRKGARVDAVLLAGGTIRGAGVLAPDAHFSMKSLKSEFKEGTCIGCVTLPGSVLAAGVAATRAKPNPFMMQCDEGVIEVDGRVTHVDGSPLEPDRLYTVASTDDLWKVGATSEYS